MAALVAIYFLLFHFHCLLISVGLCAVCLNQADQIYCPPPSDSGLEHCCGDPDLEQCCSYNDHYGITSTNEGLSNGAIAGIVIASLVICVILGLLAYFLRRLKLKLDERVMQRRSLQRNSIKRSSMNRESPVRGSIKRTSLRTSSRRRDDREPLNTRESAVFTNDGLTNPGFDDGYGKSLGRTHPMQNGRSLNQNGHHNAHHNGHQNEYNQHPKSDDMDIIGLDDSPKMYDKRKHWDDFSDPQLILELEESPKMNEKWRHSNNQNMQYSNQNGVDQNMQYSNQNGVDQAAVTMEASLRYHQLQEQHKYEQSIQLNAQQEQHKYDQTIIAQQKQDTQLLPQEVTQLHSNQLGIQYQHTHHQNGMQSNEHHVGMQLQPNQHQAGTQLQSNVNMDVHDGQPEPVAKAKKKKTSRRNLPKRIRDSEDSKWSMGYTRETVIQLKRNPSSKYNSPTASKDFDPDNPPGILKFRDSEMSDYDSVLDDSDHVFDDQSFDRPQSGFYEKLTRRSPSPKQTLAVAPFRQSVVDHHHPVPMDQLLTLDPNHLKSHVVSYSPSQLSPNQMSPTGREGRYSYFSPNEDFDNSFARSYPEFVQNKANRPKDVLPHLHIRQNSDRQTPSDLGKGVVNSPKEYVDYNRAGEELRCTSL